MFYCRNYHGAVIEKNKARISELKESNEALNAKIRSDAVSLAINCYQKAICIAVGIVVDSAVLTFFII